MEVEHDSAGNHPFSPSAEAIPGSDVSLRKPLFSAGATLEKAVERARDYAAAALAPSTVRAYRTDLAAFDFWCAAHELVSLPAEAGTLALYLSELAHGGAKLGTIRRRIAAIAGAHKMLAADSPTSHPEVRRVMQGISRTIGSAPVRKDAFTVDLMISALGSLDGSMRGTRDRALMLLAFSGAFRRSEVAALDVADLRFSRRGLTVTLRRSKTDQTAEGREVAIPVVPVVAKCAVRAVKAWLQVSHVEAGAVFRVVTARGIVTEERISGKAVARVVQRTAKASGIAGNFAAHSLRAGFVTSAAERHVADRDIARITGHKSMTVLASYVRRATAFDEPALLEVMR